MKNLLTSLILIICFNQLNAQITNKQITTQIGVKPSISAILSTKKMTAFKPNIHGFKFANTFQGIDASRKWGGLCAGMTYTVLDYYNHNMPIPQQTIRPANRYPLQSYIYKRQAKAAQEGNWDKWAELYINPLGARNSEFFGWGIEMKNPGDRMNELKRQIDAGKPVPLGLMQNNDADKYGYLKMGDHVVLAIGYDFGKYKGDKGDFLDDFKIFICDPNHPGIIMTMVADRTNNCFHYLERTGGEGGKQEAWLTYFVDSKYDLTRPPSIAELNNKNTIYVTIGTGKDDLRGGNDNLNITVLFSDGTKQAFSNVNVGARWIGNYEETVPLILNRDITDVRQIKEFMLETTFSGGTGGDNWDMTTFKATTSNQGQIYINKIGTIPYDGFNIIKRFTGSDRFLTLIN